MITPILASILLLTEPSWQSNYLRPDFFESQVVQKQQDIDPISDEVTGYLIEIHLESQKLQLISDAFLEYATKRDIPMYQIVSGNTSKIFYLKNDLAYDKFGKILSWLMLNRQNSVVSMRPILKNQEAHPFDPDKAIWMEPIVVRKGNQQFRDPEKTVVDGFHIHVDYLPGQDKQAQHLKERFKKVITEQGIFYSALDDYPEKANGPHVRAGWEIKFEKAGPTVFDRYGYSLAWLLLNHGDIPVYSHPKTWVYGENEERLISHLDSALYIGATPELNQWFFFNPEVSTSGLFRWDSQLPLQRTVSAEARLAKQKQIIEFWFGNETTDYPHTQSKLWFSKQREAKNEEFDKLILNQFQKDLVLATMGAYDSWEKTPEGKLALIILLDQFPRNMFRGTPQAFAYDRLAIAIAKRGIQAGDDKKLKFAERLFFYLPFSHSENLADQIQGVTLQANLLKEVPDHLKEIFKVHHFMADLHRKTVEKFGRLSSRNALLGRESTPEEEAYLQDPQNHF